MGCKEESQKAHALANAYEDAGHPILAGLLRVEAHNILDRGNDWKPIHKPNIGPYTDDNPGPFCMNCDEPYISGGVCAQTRPKDEQA